MSPASPHDRSERRVGGEGAAEVVDAGARGSGGGAEIDRRIGSSVEADRGAEKGLKEGHGAAGDVAADVVGVVMLDGGGVQLAAGEDAIAEAGGETLNLVLDRVSHIDGRGGGHMAIGPAGVFSVRRAGRIEQTLLGEEDIRLVGMLAVEDLLLGGGDFVECAAEVQRGG